MLECAGGRWPSPRSALARCSRMSPTATREAFPKAEQLDQLLSEGLSKNRHDITLKDNYPGRVFDVLMSARAEGWTERLIAAAVAQNPANERLSALAAKLQVKAP